MKRSNSHWRAARLAGGFLLLGALWIFASDQLLLQLFPNIDERSFAIAQSIKGLIFIGATAGVLFVLSRRAQQLQDLTLERLNATDRLYNELLANVPVGIYHTDQYGIPTRLNTQALTFLGIDKPIWEDKWYTRIHIDDQQRIKQAWQYALANKTSFHQEYRIGDDPLAPLWLVDMAYCQRDEDGTFVGYLGTLTDITDLRFTQMQEQQLQERLQIAIDAAHVGLWDMNIQTSEAWYSEELKRQIGYGDDEFPNKFGEWQTHLHPADAEESMRALQRFIRHPEEDLYSEYRLRHKNGSYRWILAQARMHFEDNRPVRILGSHIDITRLKENENRLREYKERINHLLEASPTVLYAMRFDRERLHPNWISESIQRLLGFTTKEAVQPGWWSNHVHPDDLPHALGAIEQMFSTGSARHDYRLLDREGNVRWIRDTMRLIKDQEGNPREAIGSWMDITEQQREEQRIRLYATAFNGINDGILTIGMDMTILSCNKAASQIFGYREDELIGASPSLLKSGRHRSEYFTAMLRQLTSSGAWHGEIWNRHKDGSIRPQWLGISLVPGADGVDARYVAIYTDISELKDKEEELIRQAHYDGLTGLPNRLLLSRRLDRAISEAQQHNTRFAVLFMDLDDFRSVNDSMDHTMGDELLVAVARRLSIRVRDQDTLARLGGDEFALLGERLHKAEDAGLVARDMLSVLNEPFALSNSMEIYVEACIGIAVYPDNGTTVEELMRNADTAMYRAKDLGRNNYSFHAEEMSIAVAEQLELETALRQGLERGQLLLQYQPKADLQTGKMTGAEALLRWQRPGHGLVPPNRFIPIAERSGLIVPIGEWVLRTVCRQIRSWLDLGLDPINIAVNVSARQFRTSELQLLVCGMLREFDIPPDLLCLEITESALMDNPDEVSVVLENLKSLGVKIALDDFGTGFSNMAYLARFSLDVLKIDTSFVEAIDVDHHSRSLVDSVITLASNIHLKTVAEGVETLGQLQYLRSHNCDEMQGYYFSKPLGAEEFTLWLQQGRMLQLPENK